VNPHRCPACQSERPPFVISWRSGRFWRFEVFEYALLLAYFILSGFAGVPTWGRIVTYIALDLLINTLHLWLWDWRHPFRCEKPPMHLSFQRRLG
jgi:hypothetical protein